MRLSRRRQQIINTIINKMEIGLTYTASVFVTETNTARAMGSGDLPVFATPALVALMENAAMHAVAGSLSEGETTVGAAIDVAHVKPTAMGEAVRATAELVAVDGRRLTFSLRAEDAHGEVGHGTHVRYVVNTERFMSKL